MKKVYKLDDFYEERGISLFNITKIAIDGFKNISQTTLNLISPITVLLAPNNFGKTNLLNAIEETAFIISMGPKPQERYISKNGYTSYNATDISKCFSFGIEFNSDRMNYKYSFKISPSEGIEHEQLLVGHSIIFNRINQNATMNNQKIVFPKYNLVISNALLPDDNASKYSGVVRTVFSNINSMICNGENLLDDFTSANKRIYFDDYLEELVKLRDTDNERFTRFTKTFLELFPCIKEFRIVNVFYGNDDNQVNIPDEYRLEFDSIGKKRPELYSNLSKGTRNIFLLLLEVFIKREKPLIGIEEIENGIHPSLYRAVLNSLDNACDNTKLLITTHSPSVVRHFDNRSFSSFYVGVPNETGCATFAALRDSKKDEIGEFASLHGLSLGELIFDMLSGTNEDIEKLKGWLDA